MRFEAVLFDCDGVLVDSEPITNGVLRDMLEERGWVLSSEECMRLFIGKAVKDEAALIEARTGQPVTDAWLHAFRERRNAGLECDLKAIPGVLAAVTQLQAHFGERMACASGADRPRPAPPDPVGPAAPHGCPPAPQARHRLRQHPLDLEGIRHRGQPPGRRPACPRRGPG
jgi:hypothetical protein